jgi:elongator complex protein 1
MRNLALSATHVFTIQAEEVIQFSSPVSEGTSALLSAIAFDVDRDAVFAATESEGEILVWRTPGTVSPGGGPSFVFCGSFITPNPRIVNLRVLSESSQLALVTLAGDIVVWGLDELGNIVVSCLMGYTVCGVLIAVAG